MIGTFFCVFIRKPLDVHCLPSILCMLTGGKCATVIGTSIKRMRKTTFLFCLPMGKVHDFTRNKSNELFSFTFPAHREQCLFSCACRLRSFRYGGHDILLHYRTIIMRRFRLRSASPANAQCTQCINVINVLFFFAGNFKAGPEPGTILKKLCPKEQLCFQVLMNDVLKPYVPEYKGHLTTDDGDRILLNFF